MNKKVLIILCVLLITGCQTNKANRLREDYIEKSKTYNVGEEKIIIEYVPEKEAYTETVLSGRTTSWGLKTRYEVGYGKDIEPGTYDVNSSGWANYNIFIDAVELDLSHTEKYNGYVLINPLEHSVCYSKEQNCSFMYTLAYYSKIEDLVLQEGDILYTKYGSFSGQGVSIRFEAQYVTIEHPKEEAIPEEKVEPLEIKETIRKYSSGYKCYINDYEVPNCDSLNYYDEIIKEFN